MNGEDVVEKMMTGNEGRWNRGTERVSHFKAIFSCIKAVYAAIMLSRDILYIMHL